jgi:hypothetical protein
MNPLFSKIKYVGIRFVFGKPLQVLGRIIWVSSGLISIVMVGGFVMKPLFRTLNVIFYLIFVLILYFLGKFIFSIGKKLSAHNAEHIMSKDERNPVLYLRSFIDDQNLDSYVDENNFNGDSFSSLDRFTFGSSFRLPFIKFSNKTTEEEIAEGLHWVGPCIAAGIPGERLPSGLGMARFYMEEDNWEKEIKELMLKAELVLMRAGTTKSFIRELEMAVEFVNPRRLLILLPTGFETIKTNEKSFIEIANEVLPKDFPKFDLSENSTLIRQGVLWFHDDWTPEFSFRLLVRSTFEDFARRYMNSEEKYFLNG